MQVGDISQISETNNAEKREKSTTDPETSVYIRAEANNTETCPPTTA